MPKRKQPTTTPPLQPDAKLVEQVRSGKRGAPAWRITKAGWAHVERMLRAMCTADEVAQALGISKRTLYTTEHKDRFEQLQGQKRAASILQVRERQLDKAMSGNPVDSIWWGKQHLGQTDRQAVTGANGGAIEIALASYDDMAALLDKLEAQARAHK